MAGQFRRCLRPAATGEHPAPAPRKSAERADRSSRPSFLRQAWIVERFGKFSRTLNPGLNLLVPIMEEVAYATARKVLRLASRQEHTAWHSSVAAKLARFRYVHSLKEETIAIPNQTAVTLDNVTVHIDGVLYFKVRRPCSCVRRVAASCVQDWRVLAQPTHAAWPLGVRGAGCVQVVDAHRVSYEVADPVFAVTQVGRYCAALTRPIVRVRCGATSGRANRSERASERECIGCVHTAGARTCDCGKRCGAARANDDALETRQADARPDVQGGRPDGRACRYGY